MSSVFIALLDKFGPTVTFQQASVILKFNNVKTAYTARRRGIFPVRVIDLGGRLGCSVADLAEFIQSGVAQSSNSKTAATRRPGRPSNLERQLRQLSTIKSI